MRNDPAVERAEGTALSTGGHIVWRPSRERIERSTLTAYGRWLEQTRGLAFASYAELWQWSVDDLESFWASIWEFCEIRASTPYERVLGSAEMPGARWFPGARLNFAEHIFRDRAPDGVAIAHAAEGRELAELTWRELEAATARIASALRALGVEPGDRVVAYLPNIAEAVAAFLACASIGATWSSCSPDFGARTVVDRFAQIEPKVLLAVDGYLYGGRPFDRRSVLQLLQQEIPSLEHTVVLGYLEPTPILDGLQAALSWEDLLERGDSERPGVRAAAVRPSALGALQLRYHGIAEGHRPRPRRHPARALEAPASARRPAAGRPLLLVHDDRLDDVELPRRRPADRCRDRALRRESSGTRHGRSVGSRRTCAHHLLRHERRVSRRLP